MVVPYGGRGGHFAMTSARAREDVRQENKA